MSPTISEIQVESRIIWLWTLGNFETWIEVGLYGHHLRRNYNFTTSNKGTVVVLGRYQEWHKQNNFFTFQQISVDPKTLKRYKSVLAVFMSFLDGRQPGNSYERDHVFTEAELTAVIPSDVCRYMRLKAYGAEFPSPDKNPIHSRHSGAISFDKNAIFFMPNREKWSVTRTEGNPTQS
jgi:hypothetical protein